MNHTSSTIFHDFSTPPAVEASPAAASETAASPTAEGASASQGPRRGRPSGYAPRIIDMLCESIRQYGLSDSAAAQLRGMSTSTISRWKKQFPEVAERLLQAHQQIRIHHLDLILRHAEADNMRGLRASMWILERLFPQDYSPRMEERFAHRNFEDQQRAREESALSKEDLLEMQAARAAEKAAAAEAPSAGVPATGAAAAVRAREAGTPDEATAEESAPASEEDSRNSRNSEQPPGDEMRAASESDSHYSRNSSDPASDAAPHPTQQAATAALQTHNPRDDSAEEGTPAEEVQRHSEGDSHNSRNTPITREPANPRAAR